MSRTYKKYKRCNKKTDMAFRVMNNSYSKHVSDNFYKIIAKKTCGFSWLLIYII